MCAGFSTLDNLVANGVLNFDADAYVRGERPRYAGNPFGSQELPFDQPISPYSYCAPGFGAGGYMPILPPQPDADAFVNRHEHSNVNSFKEILAYCFLGGLAMYGIHKVNQVGRFVKDKVEKMWSKNESAPKSEAKVKADTPTKVDDTKKAADGAGKDAKEAGGWFKRTFKWGNIKKVGGWTLGIGAALGALVVLKSMLTKKPHQLTPEQMQMISQQLGQAQVQPGDPTAAPQQVAEVTPATAETAPPVQVAQAPEPQPVTAPTVQVTQQAPQQEPVPEIQPVPPVQA